MATHTRFEQLADDTARAIDAGVLRPGERLPSIREAGRARRLSITTVRRAYEVLESRGLVEARPQSGFYVRASRGLPPPVALEMSRPAPVSAEVDIGRFVLDTLKAIHAGNQLPFGAPYPDPALFTSRALARCGASATRRHAPWTVLDDLPPGQPALLRQIARRHQRQGLDLRPDDIVVTAGATEALNLCLQAVARPGDTVAVESPTFYAMLQAIERLGMRAIELPTDPLQGLDLDAFAQLLQRQRIDACLTMPNFHNPLGFVMPDERKRALVALAARHGVPLIEDGVANELHYGGAPPTTLKSFDRDGGVLYCGSFSKSMGAGLRLGWALPGRWRDEVERLKFLGTLGTPAPTQLAVAEYLEHGDWDLQLRRARRRLVQRRDILRTLVQRLFPAGTRLSEPSGGFLLWVELPDGVSSLELYRRALAEGVTVTPGRVFSNADLYARCLRLNYSHEWTPEREAGLRRLAAIAQALAGGGPHA